MLISTSYFLSPKKPRERADDRIKREASELYGKGDFSNAIPKLNTYLKKHASDVETRNLLVTSYVQVGERAAALREVEHVLEARPYDIDSLYRAGQLNYELENYQQATVYFAKASDARPESIQYRYRLAESYEKIKEYNKALDTWGSVLRLMPETEANRSTVYGKIGDIYMTIGLTRKARQTYAKGLDYNPEDKNLKDQLLKVGR